MDLNPYVHIHDRLYIYIDVYHFLVQCTHGIYVYSSLLRAFLTATGWVNELSMSVALHTTPNVPDEIK